MDYYKANVMETTQQRNNTYLNILKNQNPELKKIQIINGNLDFNGQKGLNIDNFSLEILVKENHKLFNEVELISAEDFFNIVNIHLKAETIFNSEMDEEKTIEVVNTLSPPITKPKIIQKIDERGMLRNYFQVMALDGTPHIFYQNTPTDVARVYSELLKTKGSEFTLSELEGALARKMETVDMVDSQEVKNSYKPYKEEFKSNLNLLESQNQTQKFVQGNDKHELYVDGEDQVINFYRNEFGDLIKESHGKHSAADEKIDNDKQSKKEKPEVTLAIVRIDTQHYYDLLDLGEGSPKEKLQMSDFETFISELILYEEYLLPTLQKILTNYILKMEDIAVYMDDPGAVNSFQISAYNKFQEFIAKKDSYEKSKNPNQKVMVLEQQKPEDTQQRAGYMNSMLLVGLTSLVGFVIAAVMVISALQ